MKIVCFERRVSDTPLKMATMQLSKPSSKKREADTAFAENHQDLSWSLDEDIPTESQSGAQKQSNLVNELLS